MGSPSVLEIEMVDKLPATATLVRRLKREAKRQARVSSQTYTTALENLAKRCGYGSWHELHEAYKRRTGSVSTAEVPPIPIDPQLPDGFFSTPNEQRSARELRLWWDRPFAQLTQDGKLVVRCLDGGAWDRPTWYGVAETPAAAAELAATKLQKWKLLRERPTVILLDGSASGRCAIARMPQHPHDEVAILRECQNAEEANVALRNLVGRRDEK